MSDALTLLRNFVKSKKDFLEEDDKIIFGDVFFYKNVKTTYLIYGTGKDGRAKDYYTLECLAFLIKNRDLQHSMYVKNAGTRNISVVLRPDRRELLSYLDGEVETTSSIDKYAPIEIAMQRSQPYTKMTASSASSNQAGSSHNYNNNKRSAIDDDNQDHDMISKMNKSNDYSMDTSNDQQSGSNQTTKEQFIGRLTKKFDQTQSSRPITENIMPLSDQLSVEKIVSIKLKKKAQQRTKVSSEMDDDPLPSGSGSSSTNAQNLLSSQANKKEDRTSSQSKYNFDYTSAGTSNFMSGIAMVGTDDSDAIMREITQRERTCRTRFTVLQSTGKQFDKDITAFLQSIKAREEGADLAASNATLLNTTSGFNALNNSSQANLLSQQNAAAAQKSRALGYNRFDQERYSAKDETGGFSIDTKLTYQPNGGTISLATNTSQPPPPQSNLLDSLTKPSQASKPGAFFQSTQLTQQQPNIMTGSSISSSSINSAYKAKIGPGTAPLTKRSHSNPIIIIPAARTSIIQMINVADILQDLKYVSTDDKRKVLQNQNVCKESELIIHRKEDGSTVQFKVIDNIAKLAPHDWDRVVAVFAQGAQWQFKEWLIGDNPSEIFTKVKGFHLKLSGIPLDPNIAKWSVTVIELDTNKRHLDRARMLAFWDELDKYMLKSKPHLC